jgi:hypothetical protein
MHTNCWWESYKERWVGLGEIGWGEIEWIDLAQDRDKWRALMNEAMNLLVTENVGKFSSGYTAGGVSSSAQFHRVSI